MINCLKKILPYPDKWYNKLKPNQIFRVYQRYVLDGTPVPAPKVQPKEELLKAEQLTLKLFT